MRLSSDVVFYSRSVSAACLDGRSAVWSIQTLLESSNFAFRSYEAAADAVVLTCQMLQIKTTAVSIFMAMAMTIGYDLLEADGEVRR